MNSKGFCQGEITMSYRPIESYGVIGDLHSVALVGMDGSIDWCCLPNFDSPSVFAAILDDRKGGHFRVAATEESTLKQMYLPETNVLLTRFLGAEGVGEVCDFMPVRSGKRGKGVDCLHEIVRIARAVRGCETAENLDKGSVGQAAARDGNALCFWCSSCSVNSLSPPL